MKQTLRSQPSPESGILDSSVVEDDPSAVRHYCRVADVPDELPTGLAPATIVSAVQVDLRGTSPERDRMLRASSQPLSVATLADAVCLPVGVVLRLTADLLQQGHMVRVQAAAPDFHRATTVHSGPSAAFSGVFG